MTSNLAKPVKIFPGIIVRRHHTDRKQLGLLREQCAEWKKVPLQYCCNQVWMKIGWQIPWNALPICETSQIYYLMGRRPMKDVLGNHSKDQSFRLVHWLSITLQLRRTSQDSINLERKYYLVYSSDTHCAREEFGRVTYWSQTLRSWRRWTHRKSTQKRLNAKEVIFPKENGNFTFPIADGRIKLSGRDQELRTPTLIRDHPIRGEGQRDFLGEPEGSLPPPQDSFPDAGEAINDFWSMAGNFKNRHHVEPRVKLYSPWEESFPTQLKNIDVSRTTHTQIWMLCKNAASMTDGMSLILGQVSLSLLYWKRNLQTDICGPGRDWQNGR